MVSTTDKFIYFPKSFNEQMAWIGEEVEHIIKHNGEYDIKKNIQEKGRGAYGESGYTHAINRLFAIIKADSKNKAVLREVTKAEQELIDFLYDEPGALSEQQIYDYWNCYMQSYIAELENHPMHYILLKKQEGQDKNYELIGIYDSVARLQEAYNIAVNNFKQQKEQLVINAFDEAIGRWNYNLKPEQCFVRNNGKADKHKIIEFVFDNPYMYMFKLDKVKKTLTGYVYEDSMLRYERCGEETKSIRFEADYSYQILERLGTYWGGWNGTCPKSSVMAEVAKEWYEKYDAELMKISHDTLTFACRKLTEIEARDLIEEATQLYAMIIDCEQEELINHLMENETFTLWWD